MVATKKAGLSMKDARYGVRRRGVKVGDTVQWTRVNGDRPTGQVLLVKVDGVGVAWAAVELRSGGMAMVRLS